MREGAVSYCWDRRKRMDLPLPRNCPQNHRTFTCVSFFKKYHQDICENGSIALEQF